MNDIFEMNSIVLVEDHVILRQGLHSLLENTTGFHVITSVSNVVQAIQIIQKNKPNILIMDISTPRFNTTDSIQKLKRSNLEMKIIVLATYISEENVYDILKAGADGYVLKSADFSEIVRAMESVLKDKIYISTDISNNIVMESLKRSNNNITLPHKESLTIREREVLKLVGEGYKNREIADILCVCTKTVEKHRENIKRKLNLSSASSMITYAFKHDLVEF